MPRYTNETAQRLQFLKEHGYIEAYHFRSNDEIYVQEDAGGSWYLFTRAQISDLWTMLDERFIELLRGQPVKASPI